MSLEIKGRIIAVLEEKTGEGKNGKWQSQDAVIETDGQYPKKVCFNMFGDKIIPLEEFRQDIEDRVRENLDFFPPETVKMYQSAKMIVEMKVAIYTPLIYTGIPF